MLIIQLMADVAVVPAPPARDWSELPLDVLRFIFADKLGAVDVLMGAGLVCRSWLQAAMAPDVWRCVEIEDLNDYMVGHDALCAMAKASVDRSGGQLQLFSGKRFVTSELLLYIAERSPALNTLCVTECGIAVNDKLLIQVMKKAPLLELCYLEIMGTGKEEELNAIYDSCPRLEALNLRPSQAILGTGSLEPCRTLQYQRRKARRAMTRDQSRTTSAPVFPPDYLDGVEEDEIHELIMGRREKINSR